MSPDCPGVGQCVAQAELRSWLLIYDELFRCGAKLIESDQHS